MAQKPVESERMLTKRLILEAVRSGRSLDVLYREALEEAQLPGAFKRKT